jgi:hypothetical protein
VSTEPAAGQFRGFREQLIYLLDGAFPYMLVKVSTSTKLTSRAWNERIGERERQMSGHP